MFIPTKDGKQYFFSVEVSSKEINEQTFAETLSFFDQTLHKEKNIRAIDYSSNIDIPVSIFREGNNGLRAIVKFLKEEKKLTFSRISRLLERDQRTIWSAYHGITKRNNITEKKQNKKRKIDSNKILNSKTNKSDLEEPSINSSIFANRKFSILESAAMHLLQNYSVKETAQILGRNQMTIWTVKRRAEQKSREQTKNQNKESVTHRKRKNR